MSDSPDLVLASASPRRRELLACLGLAFTVRAASGVDESLPGKIEDPVVFARDLSDLKAREVAADFPDSAIIAADTIVVLDNSILGKPESAEEARRTLRQLRGREHQVTTAVALVFGEQSWIDHVTTNVVMRDYSDEEIERYIESDEPFDKAGSYAIQDRQFRPVERYEGCYCNVVGLPLLLTHRMLEEAGFDLRNLNPASLPPQCRSCPNVVPAIPADKRAER